MNNLKVSETRDYFTLDGKPFFYLADTAWSAFISLTIDEWEEYLDYRKAQNFNVLQINILPQFDRSPDKSNADLAFAQREDGTINFGQLNPKYFEHAALMVEMACNRGFIPALAVLWSNFVPETWTAQGSPYATMPFEAVKPYVRYAVNVFSKFNPIYLISGDTDFTKPTACEYYMEALKTVKETCPNALTSMHPTIDISDYSKAIEDSPLLDFYMYQSAHIYEKQYLTYKLAEAFYKKEIKRPIVNGEPCYEGHGYNFSHGRFRDIDIRKAVWQSLLSSAKAGVTYGAHGVWGFHKNGEGFKNDSFSGRPYYWRDALKFRGAWDASFTRYIFETYNMFDIEPCDWVVSPTGEIRCSASNDLKKIVIYAQHNYDIIINGVLSDYKWVVIDLNCRNFTNPNIEFNEGKTIVKMNNFNSDVLVIGISLQQ